MGFKVTKNGDHSPSTLVELVADKVEDIEHLPIYFSAGSNCIVLENSSVWMLGTDKVWHQI